MSQRYRPNEATCPIPIELLALLLRSGDARVEEIVAGHPEAQRAALAAFCFQRSHMRRLGLVVATQCSREILWKTAGFVGEVLFDQSRDRASFDNDVPASTRRRVTLARVA